MEGVILGVSMYILIKNIIAVNRNKMGNEDRIHEQTRFLNINFV